MKDANSVTRAGLPDKKQGDPFLPGPTFAGTYHFSGEPASSPYTYGRYHNPTWSAYELALSQLEGGNATVAFASGMAAIAAVLGTNLKPGERLVLPSDAYYTTRLLANGFFTSLGVDVQLAPTAGSAQREHLQGAKLLWLESPSNPRLDVCDIALLVEAAHAAGALVLVDNTTATCLGQKPLALGADFSLSSDTKGTSGHSDLILGHVSVRESSLAEKLRTWRTQMPLVNFPVMKHMIEYAIARNRAYGKDIEFTMVSNLAMMDEEKLAYLIDHKVQICTSIDGPEHLHTKQRKLIGGNSHREAVRWIERINKAYIDIGLDPTLYHVEALLTTTREALKLPREIVDTYVSLGCRAIFLRPVDPFGFAGKTAQIVEYDRSAYHEFYGTAVEHILDLNRKGEQVLERYASIFLTKILGDDEPNFLDIRSPSGSGIGALAYNYDGKIFTSDEGRMMYETGDPAFQIGDVFTAKYRELMKHETIRALVMASIRETQPDCVNCAYTPYCGVQPEHSYRTQGTIFGRMRESTTCAVHKGIQDFLFGKLRENDPKTTEILRRWTTVRARTHFIQASSAS